MGRRSDHTREELYDLALEAAASIAEVEGLRGLTARRIAKDIGYTHGTLYNVFEDLDDLVVHLNGRTLDALYESLKDLRLDGEPETALGTLARGYVAFTRLQPRLWNLLFEHHLPEGRELPDWHYEKVLRLLALVETALAPLFLPGQEAERHHSARVLWSALHGICSLEASRKMAEWESVEALAGSLIEYYIAGLQGRIGAT